MAGKELRGEVTLVEACEMLVGLEDDETVRERVRNMKPWPNPYGKQKETDI